MSGPCAAAEKGARNRPPPLTALMTLITYQGRAVAIAAVDRFSLAVHIDRLPDRHSLKTFVCFLVLYARDVHTGELPGDSSHYEPADGERYARAALIPAREFRALAHRPDRDLAERFGVPVEQIARRRRDLVVCPLRDIAWSPVRRYGRNDRPTSRRRTGC
jgi:hypothetical protein